MDDTKIIYHIDDEETPYLVKLPVPPGSVTLGDFKNALNRPSYKFFFKSLDADFGVVKEEVTDDDARLPCFSGKVISWLVSADGSTKSDNPSGSGDIPSTNHPHNSSKTSSKQSIDVVSPSNRPIEPPSEQEHAVGTTGVILEGCDTCGDTDSVCSRDRVPPLRNFPSYKHGSRLGKFNQRPQTYETSSSLMSSDLESTSFFDSEDDSSRFSSATGTTMSSANYARHQRKQRHKRRRILPIRRINEDASSFSSMTDSTMSLNVITVTLNLDTVNFLGISIVGQSNKAGDGGIYVGSIMRGGAVAQDGRIEPGDMILEVNRISFEDMSNDEAVRILREEVQKPGPITLVVAKCWDPSPKDYFTLSRQDSVHPIDTLAWVLHTNAMTGCVPLNESNNVQPQNGMNIMHSGFFPLGANPGLSIPGVLPPQMSALNSMPHASNMTSKSLPEVADSQHLLSDPRGYRTGCPGSSGVGPGTSSTKTRSIAEMDSKTGASLLAVTRSTASLTVAADMPSVVHSILLPDSGLDIRDRTWLKITIPNAFIGSDLVDWLYNHIDGFADRKEARRYACEMLKCGYIRHTVNKNTFSEQCYYVFGDIATALAQLSLDDINSVSEVGGSKRSRGNCAPRSVLPYCYPQRHSAEVNLATGPPPHQLLPPSAFAMGSNELGGIGQAHYPYPQLLYPTPAAAAQASSFADGATGSASLFNPTSAVTNQKRPNGNSIENHINPQLGAFPRQASDCTTTGVKPLPDSSGCQVENSSSSCSSHSSPSSASSSSSASSDTRHCRRPSTANPPPSSNGSGTGGVSGSGAIKLSQELLVNPPGYARNLAPSVQSVSGASSASSASRQNGTGTSGGSGSTRACRMSSSRIPAPSVPHLDSSTESRSRDKFVPSLVGRLDKNSPLSDVLVKLSATSCVQPVPNASSRIPQ